MTSHSEPDLFSDSFNFHNDDYVSEDFLKVPTATNNFNFDDLFPKFDNFYFVSFFSTTINKRKFKTEKAKTRRGRKINNKFKNKIHDSSSYDNIITKVQVHFLSFVINLMNDCILYFLKNPDIKFFNFLYAEKSNIKQKYLENLKKCTIEDLLKNMKISKKYDKSKKYNNKNLVEKLTNLPWFNKIFEMNFLELFLIYHNNEQPLEELSIFDETIKLSNKTESFYNLLLNNKNLKKEIIEYTQMTYIIDAI